jgi:hypothetical protein
MAREATVKDGSTVLYRTKEFAELAGVTVRTLDNYDRLGLLKPARRTESGYRFYSDRDFARLEEIVVLKFLPSIRSIQGPHLSPRSRSMTQPSNPEIAFNYFR